MATEEKVKLTPGTFCWADLSSTDYDATHKFYSELLGWEFNKMDMGEGNSYTMLKVGNDEIGGMYPMDEKQRTMGMPSYWTSYILVEDVDASAEKAQSLGATIMMPPFDVGQFGRMAIIQDPSGAAFALWKDRQGESSATTGVGTFCWNELLTEDTEKAGEFYTKFLGWEQEAMPFSEMKYDVFKEDGAPKAGMMTLPAEAKANGAPPHWLLYVSVADCDGTVEKAKQLGGGVCMPPMDFEGVGRGAVLTDPTGGVFGIIHLNG